MLSAYRKEGALISTQRLKELMRIEDPEGADSREFQGRRRRGRMDVVGPNRFFALDGYDKFLEWGFKIYGWIDGYSRFLPQLYCGIDNKTAISIWIRTRRLYRKLGYMPELLRTDKGVETPLLAGANVLLRRAQTRSEAPDPASRVDIPFGKCFAWGTASRDIRIERWWCTLARFSINDI
jgi:hypothetical protein